MQSSQNPLDAQYPQPGKKDNFGKKNCDKCKNL